MYPFATQNETDFSNLMGVYLDAVFKPLLQEHDFLQEGHRLEIEKREDKEELVFKGVVYNEMKVRHTVCGLSSLSVIYAFFSPSLCSVFPIVCMYVCG